MTASLKTAVKWMKEAGRPQAGLAGSMARPPRVCGRPSWPAPAGMAGATGVWPATGRPGRLPGWASSVVWPAIMAGARRPSRAVMPATCV